MLRYVTLLYVTLRYVRVGSLIVVLLDVSGGPFYQTDKTKTRRTVRDSRTKGL